MYIYMVFKLHDSCLVQHLYKICSMYYDKNLEEKNKNIC